MSSTFKILNGDVSISSANGRPALISDAIKLRQDINEFFTVEVTPSGLGAGLDQLIGTVEISPEVFTSIAYRQIEEGLLVFKSLQASDSRIPRNGYETLLDIQYMAIEMDPADPTKFYFIVNLVTESGDELSLNTSISS